MNPPTRQPQTSWKNGSSTKELSQNRRKRIHMKVRGMSLGIDVSHRYLPIDVLSVRLGNFHLTLQMGVASLGAHNTVLLVPDVAIVASG